MILHTGWSNSAFNPKNWGGGGSSSSSSTPKIDTDSAVSQAINTKDDGSTAQKNYTASLANDLSMGLSTFGLTGQAQIDKLVESGYSESAARDFQARTEATKKRMAESPPGGGGDDNNSSTTTTTTEDDTSTDDTTTTADDGVGTSATNTTTLDTSSSGTSDNITAGGTGTAASGVAEAEQIIAQADGPAEAAVAETAKKGRRANIQTTSQGLLTDEDELNLRRRRSLMGGGLIN